MYQFVVCEEERCLPDVVHRDIKGCFSVVCMGQVKTLLTKEQTISGAYIVCTIYIILLRYTYK